MAEATDHYRPHITKSPPHHLTLSLPPRDQPRYHGDSGEGVLGGGDWGVCESASPSQTPETERQSLRNCVGT